jgi:hypothetical protein
VDQEVPISSTPTCASQEEARKAEEDAVELIRQKIAADKVVVDTAAAAEAK